MKKIYAVSWTYETALKDSYEPCYHEESHIVKAFHNREDAVEFAKQNARETLANVQKELEDEIYDGWTWKFNEWVDSKIGGVITPNKVVWTYLECEDCNEEEWYTLTIDEIELS